MRKYDKPFLTVPEQAQLMESRGLIVSHADRLEHALSTIGYYRLSGYLYPFRVPHLDGPGVSDQLMPGTTADQVLSLYEFDRRLKLLVMDAVERIEIAIRFRVAYRLGMRDPFGHLKPECLDGVFSRLGADGSSKYDRWLAEYRQTQSRAREDFVTHFETQYRGSLPIWVAVEILQFGQLSILYQNLKHEDRSHIAKHYGLPNHKIMASWLHTVNYVRNICAHHARFWNRHLVVQPKRVGPGFGMVGHLRSSDAGKYSFGALLLLAHFMSFIEASGTWLADMNRHLMRLPVGGPITYQSMGFPNAEEPLTITTS